MLKSRFPQIIAELPVRMHRNSDVTAERIRAAAYSTAPVGSGMDDPHPGRLRESLHVEHDDEGVWVVADAAAEPVRGRSEGAPYGHMVEYGSVHNVARPFLHPAAEENRAGWLTRAVGILRTL